MNKFWFRIRWLDGRNGHANYLMAFLAITNFIIITHRFLLEKEAVFSEIFSNLWIFGIFFLVTYFPISIIIGNWHKRTQVSIETTIKNQENPLFVKMVRMWLDTETGKASEEEIKKFRELIHKIERNK